MPLAAVLVGLILLIFGSGNAFATPNYPAVAQALNNEALKPGVEIDAKSGELIATFSTEESNSGLNSELEAVVNQSLLQASASGLDVVEFYSNKSLVMYLPNPKITDPFKDSMGFRAYSNLRFQSATGELGEKTIIFQKQAGILGLESQPPHDRAISLEQANESISAELGQKVTNWSRITLHQGTLSECDRRTLNKAFQESSAAFRQKYQARPIAFVDFGSSETRLEKIKKSLTEERPKSFTRSGQWALVLTDETGKKTMVTQLSFQVQAPPFNQTREECSGENYSLEILPTKEEIRQMQIKKEIRRDQEPTKRDLL